MKIYDYKFTKSLSWCLVLCMSLFFMTNSVSAQDDISCDDQINVSVGADCMFTVAAGLFTEGDNPGVEVHFSTNPVTKVAIDAEVKLDCGTYTVTVVDASGNSCWGTVVVEDKLPPQSTNPCPADDPCDIDCVSFASGTWPAIDQSIYLESVVDCSGIDRITGPNTNIEHAAVCTDPDILHLIYNPVDGKGNIGADTLHYLIQKITIRDLSFPGTFYGTCESPTDPDVKPSDGGPGAPYYGDDTDNIPVFGNDNNAQVCDLLISYEDLELPACGDNCANSKKILRTWTFLDWCASSMENPQTPGTGSRVQVLHLKDDINPTIAKVDGQREFSVDPWLCEVEVLPLPTPDGDDTCNPDNLHYIVNGPAGVQISTDGTKAYNVPKGVHTFTYFAKDCCGNISDPFSFTITVYDNVKPVAIAKQFTVISLANVPDTDGGLAKMYAESLDNGSYDRCTDVHLQIRRDGYYATGGSTADDLDYTLPHDKDDLTCYSHPFYRGVAPGPYATYPCDLVGNDTYADDNNASWNLPNGCNGQRDTDEGRYVKFCCADLEAATVDVNYDGVLDKGYVKVWLRVWDNADMTMDANGNPTYGTKGDLFNETWGYVKVEVSSPPILTVSGDDIPCDWPFEQKFEDGYYSQGSDWFDDHISAEGICDVNVEVIYWDYTDNVCPGGYYYLEYTATNRDSKGLSVTKGVRINVTDLDPTTCNHINWPPSYVEVSCIDINEEPYLDWNADACDLIGWTVRSDTFRFESNACVKVINEYTVIDWCAYDAWYDFHNGGTNYGGPNPPGYFEGGHDGLDGRLCQDPNFPYFHVDRNGSENGVFKYIEVIKVVDDIAPVIVDEEDKMYAIDNEGCYTTITLVNSATDGSDDECPATWFKWEVTVDRNMNGDFEDDYVYKRDINGQVLRGMDLNFLVWEWDRNRRIPWYVGGPMKTFDVRYIVFDGCGNVDKEIITVMAVDKKDPTPYCYSLSSAVMVNGQVELWANDFNVGSFDNCYGENLAFTFDQVQPRLGNVRNNVPWLSVDHYFKAGDFVEEGNYFLGVEASYDEYVAGDAQWWDASKATSGMIFTCDDVAASPVDVKMSAWDGKFNTDFCVVTLTLVDNQGGCDAVGPRAAISGTIATEEVSTVSEVEVTLENLSNPEYELTVTTGNDGDFAFASNPMYNGYDISAVKDGDDTEGVSTLDLVLIQRHILGITPFESPYKVIAADINSDRRVSGTDLVVLRKTILGIYKEFPTNNSWRFVEQSQSLSVDNALTDFNEVININALDANMVNEDFIAVKIGDVNATAKTNARDLGTSTRSAGTISLELNEQNVSKGDLVDLTFSSKDFNEVYGYQFTLELNGLSLQTVREGSALMTDANVGILDNNTVTVSYSDVNGLGSSDNLFTFTVQATQDGTISNMIALTSSALNNEAYIGSGLNIHDVALTINGEEATSFRLDQNEPNPFDETTVIGFELPTAGNTSLTVYDVAGKVIKTVTGQYAQGYNEIRLTKNDLNTTGVLYYTLKSGEFTATKKMIIIE